MLHPGSQLRAGRTLDIFGLRPRSQQACSLGVRPQEAVFKGTKAVKELEKGSLLSDPLPSSPRGSLETSTATLKGQCLRIGSRIAVRLSDSCGYCLS